MNTKIKIKMLGKKFFYAVTVKDNEKTVTVKIHLTLWMRISSKAMTEGMKELREELAEKGVEVDIRKLYDKFVEICDEKLPGLYLY